MNEKESPWKQIIIVQRESFSFGEKFERDYGKYKLKRNNNLAEAVEEFSLGDIAFIKPSGLSPERVSTFEAEIIERGFVPLDIYCAQAFFKAMEKDYSLALSFYSDAPSRNIAILGSVIINEDDETSNSGREHYAFFKYEGMGATSPEFLCYEDDECIFKDDCTIVFKKSFLEKPKDERYLKIRNLREQVLSWKSRYEELDKIHKELLEKYEKEVCKISKPHLSTETIELLCKRVCDFEFGVRVIKATEYNDIIYLFQLISYSKNDLDRLRNIKKVSIKRIGELIAGLGLSLGTNFSQEEYNYFWKKVEEK